jgi:hypothetical protein
VSVLRQSRAVSLAQKHSNTPIANVPEELASMAKYQSTNNSTDGPPSADSVIRKYLEENKACELIIEERKTKRPEAAGGVGVNIVLGDREVVYGLSYPHAHHNAAGS